MNFDSNGTDTKFTVLVHFGVQFTAGKPKTLLKTKISGKTAFLGISNDVSPRSQKNHKILAKLTKNKNVGYKLGINYRLRPRQRVIRYSDIAYNRTIHLYFLGCQVLASEYLLFSTLPRTNNIFFVQDPIVLFFTLFYSICFFGWLRGLGTVTPVTNVRLSSNFVQR